MNYANNSHERSSNMPRSSRPGSHLWARVQEVFYRRRARVQEVLYPLYPRIRVIVSPILFIFLLVSIWGSVRVREIAGVVLFVLVSAFVLTFYHKPQ